jgi:hypothetical protein
LLLKFSRRAKELDQNFISLSTNFAVQGTP